MFSHDWKVDVTSEAKFFFSGTVDANLHYSMGKKKINKTQDNYQNKTFELNSHDFGDPFTV